MTLSGRPHLSVVLPAYNEEKRLAQSLPVVVAYLREREIAAEILVVDDGSSDATARVAADLIGSLGRVVPNGENRGKGYSVRHGVLEAQGSWVLMTDADLSTPIEEYDKLAAEVRDHDLDLAFGSRAVSGARVEIRQNVLRQTMGKSFNRILRLATGLPHGDTQCGFKLMDRKRVRPLFEKMVIDRFAWDVELLYLCHRFGLRVKEVPVIWRNSPDSRVSIVGDPLNMFYDVLRVRWRFRQGAYNPDNG